MAHALQIDTLAFSKRLKEAGADDGLAEAIVEGITAADTSELATKADLAEVRADLATVEHALKADIAEVKADIDRVEHALKADIDRVELGLKVEISKTGNRTALLIGGLIAFLYTIDRIVPLLGASGS